MLDTLPVELISLIASACSTSSLNALSQVNTHLHAILTPVLYKRDIASAKAALKWAVLENSPATVGRCLDFGASLDPAGYSESNPSLLCFATQNQRLEIVDLLLTRGANPDCGYGDPACPFVPIVLSWHNAQIQTRLIRAGANLNPLLMVFLVIGRKPEDVRALIARGADIRLLEESSGISPLFFAAEDNRLDLLTYLLDEVGLDPLRCPDGNGGVVSLLAHAAEKGHDGVVRFLLGRGVSPDAGADGTDGWTGLLFAAAKGHVQVVRTLLDAGADPGVRDGIGRTALGWAAFRGHLAVVQALLAPGHGDVDAECVDNGGHTPLMLASAYGHAAIAALLVRHGASVDRVHQTDGRTALSYAAQEGFLDVVWVLVDAGADVNSVNPLGATPLEYAAYEGHLGVVKLLLRSGADATMRDVNGQTALSLARLAGRELVVEALVEWEIAGLE